MIPNKRKLLRKIIDPTEDKHDILNGLKLLFLEEKRKYWANFRNRERNVTYYTVTLRGNWIRLYRIQYLYNDKPVNAFISAFTIDKDELSSIKPKSQLVAKYPLSQSDSFLDKFSEIVEEDKERE
jgi:hypothetical protein